MRELEVMGVDMYESREFRQLEQRLMAQFSPPLSAEEVSRCLVECIRRFEGARVRTYLWVLIERAATDRVRAAVLDVDVSRIQPESCRAAREMTATSSGADRLVAVGGL